VLTFACARFFCCDVHLVSSVFKKDFVALS
jgi:hypothetical protein